VVVSCVITSDTIMFKKMFLQNLFLIRNIRME